MTIGSEYSSWVLERVGFHQVLDIIRLKEGTTTLGRCPSCDIRMYSTFSSRLHCKFTVSEDGRVTLEDFSSNGTFVNRHQYKHQVVELHEGDRIGLGSEGTEETLPQGIYYVYILRRRPFMNGNGSDKKSSTQNKVEESTSNDDESDDSSSKADDKHIDLERPSTSGFNNNNRGQGIENKSLEQDHKIGERLRNNNTEEKDKRDSIKPNIEPCKKTVIINTEENNKEIGNKNDHPNQNKDNQKSKENNSIKPCPIENRRKSEKNVRKSIIVESNNPSDLPMENATDKLHKSNENADDPNKIEAENVKKVCRKRAKSISHESVDLIKHRKKSIAVLSFDESESNSRKTLITGNENKNTPHNMGNKSNNEQANDNVSKKQDPENTIKAASVLNRRKSTVKAILEENFLQQDNERNEIKKQDSENTIKAASVRNRRKSTVQSISEENIKSVAMEGKNTEHMFTFSTEKIENKTDGENTQDKKKSFETKKAAHIKNQRKSEKIPENLFNEPKNTINVENSSNSNIKGNKTKSSIQSNTSIINSHTKDSLNKSSEIEEKISINKNQDFVNESEVYVISDDDDDDIDIDKHLSQALIRDIKQEVADFESEESFGRTKAKKEEKFDEEEKFDDEESKPMSPIIEIDDDEEDYDYNLSQWVMKLSQNSNSKSKPNLEIKKAEINVPVEIKESKVELKKLKFEAKERKVPEVINPPSLPVGKGKLRGVSAAPSPLNMHILEQVENHGKSIRQKERLLSFEKDLKQKWFQKPTLQRAAEREEKKKLQEERKQKLKELAEEQLNKRKLNDDDDDDDDVKVVKMPRVKVTKTNRGAFLTEEIEKPPVIQRPAIKPILGKIPKLTNKIPLNKNSTAENSPASAENIENEKKQDTPPPEPKERDPLLEIKIKHRKARVSISSAGDLQKNESSLDNNIEMQDSSKIDIGASTSIAVPVSSISDADNSSFKSIVQNKVTQEKKGGKRVRFNDTPQIFYIEAVTDAGRKVDAKDASIDLSDFQPKIIQEQVKKFDYSQKITSEILSWLPDWLEQRSAEVNGPGHVLLPMLHKFSSFEEFFRILIPLMKLELWSSIEQDFHNRKSTSFITLRVEDLKAEKRDTYDRHVYHCSYNLSSKQDSPFTPGDLCILKIETPYKSASVFAIVEYNRKNNTSQKPHYHITLESNANDNCMELIQFTKIIKLKPITSIRVDVGAFNAVYQLKYSPLLNTILDPHILVNIPEPSTAAIESTRYKGYDDLNQNQREILLKTYLKCSKPKQPNICLIEGPPGTGKSRVISNLAMQLLYGPGIDKLKKKILICAQSNTAIDVIVLKLMRIRSKMTKDKFALVRFGILERMHPSVRPVSVQNLVEHYIKQSHHGASETLRNEQLLLEARLTALKQKSAHNSNNVNNDELQQLKQRLDLINRIQNQQVTQELEKDLHRKRLQGAHIVSTTLSSCIKLSQYTKYFDICIIDEATQCLEPWTLIPFQFDISSLVLVGDTQQLPATVLSQVTTEYGYGQSLFTRIQKSLEMDKTNPICSLQTQYRMHPEICKWPNSYFYQNKLINDDSTSAFKMLIKPYAIFDLYHSQNTNSSGGQISNSLEATFVMSLFNHIISILPIPEYSYGIITPYSQHRDIINKKLKDAGIKSVVVNTIDSYQGKEKDVIIISNARTRGVGFLSNSQRLNVALTRAKKCLILCGNFSNLYKIPAWKSLLEDAKSRGILFQLKPRDELDFKEKVMCHLKV